MLSSITHTAYPHDSATACHATGNLQQIKNGFLSCKALAFYQIPLLYHALASYYKLIAAVMVKPVSRA